MLKQQNTSRRHIKLLSHNSTRIITTSSTSTKTANDQHLHHNQHHKQLTINTATNVRTLSLSQLSTQRSNPSQYFLLQAQTQTTTTARSIKRITNRILNLRILSMMSMRLQTHIITTSIRAHSPLTRTLRMVKLQNSSRSQIHTFSQRRPRRTNRQNLTNLTRSLLRIQRRHLRLSPLRQRRTSQRTTRPISIRRLSHLRMITRLSTTTNRSSRITHIINLRSNTLTSMKHRRLLRLHQHSMTRQSRTRIRTTLHTNQTTTQRRITKSHLHKQRSNMTAITMSRHRIIPNRRNLRRYTNLFRTSQLHNQRNRITLSP